MRFLFTVKVPPRLRQGIDRGADDNPRADDEDEESPQAHLSEKVVAGRHGLLAFLHVDESWCVAEADLLFLEIGASNRVHGDLPARNHPLFFYEAFVKFAK